MPDVNSNVGTSDMFKLCCGKTNTSPLLVLNKVVHKKTGKARTVVGDGTLSSHGHICSTAISVVTERVPSSASQSHLQFMSHLMFVVHPRRKPSASNTVYVLWQRGFFWGENDTFSFIRMSAVLFGPRITAQWDVFSPIHTETPGVVE